uniref:Uncharacterized protein n=1 Tax=Sinocyclocheilus grahami TaxID=75366 RepID=A0A672RSS3_SINGR
YQSIQNLPIDIQTSKLLDWLVDQRHCTLKWQSAVTTIREKISAAIQDMPENEDNKHLLSGSCIHYCHSAYENFLFRLLSFLCKSENGTTANLQIPVHTLPTAKGADAWQSLKYKRK